MILEHITELRLAGVLDRGVPNQERIAFQAMDRLNLGFYALVLGVRSQPGLAVPIRDNYFWFGDAELRPNEWVFVYTCEGSPRTGKLPNTDLNFYTVSWGRKQVVLLNPNVIPILLRLDGVALADGPLALPPSKRESQGTT